MCAHLGSFWPLRRHVRARFLPLYMIRPYKRASRDPPGLPGPGRSCWFFFFTPPPPQRRLIPGASSPSCAHLRSALRNEHRSGDGWMGGWTDGCGCRVESPASAAVITSKLGLPFGGEIHPRVIYYRHYSPPSREERRRGRLGALENTKSRGSCVWELPIPSR